MPFQIIRNDIIKMQVETMFVGGAWKEDIDRDFEKRGGEA